MKLPRFTVAALMGWVVLVAVGIAALKYPTRLGADLLVAVLAGSIMVATLGAIAHKGARRMARIGAAFFGVTYTLMVFGLETPLYPPSIVYDFLNLVGTALHPQFLNRPGMSPVSPWALLTTPALSDWTAFYHTGQALIGLGVTMLGGHLGRFLADSGARESAGPM